MEPTNTKPQETVSPTQQSNLKVYPFEHEDVQYEEELAAAIKRADANKRLQLIALNNLTLIKKQQSVDQDFETKAIVGYYNKFQEPITKATQQIVEGARSLTEAEIKSLTDFLTKEEAAKLSEANKQEPIPEYWYTAIINCPPINAFIEEHDRPILKHVTRIEYKPEEETDHFTITFHFSPNDYFENPFLAVKFIMVDEEEPEGLKATEIKWKEGKNITKKVVTKRQKNKKTGNSREVHEEEEAPSFFNFFKNIDIEETAENYDEDEGEILFEKLNSNLELARKIETELLPYDLEYYLGIRKPVEEEDEEEEISPIKKSK